MTFGILEVLGSMNLLCKVKNIEYTNNKPIFEVNNVKNGKEASVKIKSDHYGYD